MLSLWQMRLNGWRKQRAREQCERVERYIDRRLGLAPSRACYQQAGAVFVGAGTLLCRVQARFYLYVPSRDINITPALANFGRVDPWISRVIAQVVQPGMVVADIGANVGYFTMQLAHQVGSGGRVHAFEPNTELAGLVRRSVAANSFDSDVVIHAVPLGGEDGREMWLCVPGDALAGSAVHDDDWRRHWTEEQTDASSNELHVSKEAHPVTLQRLDSFPDAAEIAFAKIDVEGFEPQVWAGMERLLAGDALRSIVLEYAAGHYADADAFRAQIYRPGWSVSLIDHQTGPAPISREALSQLDPTRACDLLLMR